MQKLHLCVLVSAPLLDTSAPIDLHIRNVVVTFSVRCHVDLRKLVLSTVNAVYERSKGVCFFDVPSYFGLPSQSI